MIPAKRYLGDGVYVAWNGYAIELTTENGVHVIDRIVIDPLMYAQFKAWARELFEEARRDDRARGGV